MNAGILVVLIILGSIAAALLLGKIIGPDRVTRARDEANVRYWEGRWRG
jgi:type II secretory pathway pseudopilin PulG